MISESRSPNRKPDCWRGSPLHGLLQQYCWLGGPLTPAASARLAYVLPNPSGPDAHRSARSRDMGLCRLLALLADTAAYLQQRTGQPCLLAATELGSAEGPRHYLTGRWLPVAIGLRAVGSGQHRLAVVAPRALAAQQMQVDYSLRHSALMVEGLQPPPSPTGVLLH